MIRIEINTDNEAFRPSDSEEWREETSSILHDLADRIATGQTLPVVVRDSNGNRVCHAEAEPSEPISATAGERETM